MTVLESRNVTTLIALLTSIFIGLTACGRQKKSANNNNAISQISNKSAEETSVVADKVKDKPKTDVTPITDDETIVDCAFNGQTIVAGASVEAYQAKTAEFGTACVKETRVCTTGILSGSYSNETCTQICSLDGQTIVAGASIDAYLTKVAHFGSVCTKEVRSCLSGKLSGSYKNATCVQAVSVESLSNATPKTNSIEPYIAGNFEGYRADLQTNTIYYGSVSIATGTAVYNSVIITSADQNSIRNINNFHSESPGLPTRSKLFASDSKGIYCGTKLLAGVTADKFYVVDGLGFFNGQLFDSGCVAKTVDMIGLNIQYTGYALTATKAYVLKNTLYETAVLFEPVAGVNIATFKTISTRFASDSSFVYNSGAPTPIGAGFFYLRDDFYAVGTNLFCGLSKAASVDPGTLTAIQGDFVADGNAIYVCRTQNAVSFHALTTVGSPAKFRLYAAYESLYTTPLDYAYGQDGANVYFTYRGETITKLPQADIATFHPADSQISPVYGGYALDATTAYRNGSILVTDIDSASFKVLNIYFTKDKNHVYAQGTVVLGLTPADIASPQLIPDIRWGLTFSNYLKSANMIYYHSVPLVGANASNTVKICDGLSSDRLRLINNGTDLCYQKDLKVDCTPSATSTTNTGFDYLDPNNCP